MRRLDVRDLRLEGGRSSDAPLSFTLRAGECVALLIATPHTDASLLLDSLAGYTAVTAGRILVGGTDVTGRPAGRRRISIISERDPLFDHLSVHGNVAFPLTVRHVREPERGHRVRQVLALLGLEALADRKPAALTPGETVRVALARTLISDPALILLDNPLDQLDPVSRQTLQQLLRRLARAQGLTLLLATRDRNEALLMGDRIGILDGRSLRQLGTAGELLDQPCDEKVASIFGEANRLTGRVDWVEDDVARVRLSAGPSMDARATDGLSAGDLCVVCVRPERIAVAFLSGGGEALGADALTGTLSEMVHLGDHLRLRFRLAGGGEVLVRRPASQPTAGLLAERPALLAWQATHAIAFRLDDEPHGAKERS